jgi:hypothetical protein
VACARIVAKGEMPRFTASERRMRTSAAAPSEIELEFAAVTLPPSLNAGLGCGILSSFAFSGCSSCKTIRSAPLLLLTATGVISFAKLPSAITRCAHAHSLLKFKLRVRMAPSRQRRDEIPKPVGG